jgi:hypothetical protein
VADVAVAARPARVVRLPASSSWIGADALEGEGR